MFCRSILFYAICVALASSMGHAFPSTGRTQILPKGRRALSYSELNLSVPGRYNSLGQYSTLAVEGSLNFTDLKSASDQIEKVITSIDEISPGLSTQLELGSFQLDPRVSGKARIFGLGWGITDRLMFGIGIPLINATVEMKGGYTQSPALSKASKELREQSRTADPDRRQQLDVLAQLLERAPKVTAEVLQDYFVNTMGYEPLGTWTGNNVGDTRLFMHYNYYLNFWTRNGVRWGVDLPTGRGDDPDIINDFAFGTESYAPFIETIHDFPILGPKLSLSVSASYKYFVPTKKTMRLIEEVPISDVKERVRFKKGDSFEYLVGASSELFWHTEFFGQVIFVHSARDK
ncbi:MAG: hypothetical protein KDD38_09000 [Bdellovibrionales bacterium]|nr:hypothetical protein [Bdellovibrionales bacterium]